VKLGVAGQEVVLLPHDLELSLHYAGLSFHDANLAKN
jgi:hypothetical protein